MKRIQFIFFLLLVFQLSSYAQTQNDRIRTITSDIDQYKDRVIVINLKLKYLDRIFEKIIFYDSDNIDIEFDISGKEKRNSLRKNLFNTHEGMLYVVKFKVIGEGNLGGLLGDLISFTPVILDIIPEKKSRSE